MTVFLNILLKAKKKSEIKDKEKNHPNHFCKFLKTAPYPSIQGTPWLYPAFPPGKELLGIPTASKCNWCCQVSSGTRVFGNRNGNEKFIFLEDSNPRFYLEALKCLIYPSHGNFELPKYLPPTPHPPRNIERMQWFPVLKRVGVIKVVNQAFSSTNPRW